MRRLICTLAALLLTGVAQAEEVNSLLARIKAVGKEGAGNVEAAQAWKELTAKGPGVLPDVLAALDDASPVAGNWLRAAVETIRDETLAAGKPLPAEELEAFIRDTSHAGQARRLAYDLLVEIDPKTPERLLPGMYNDPGQELRRDAVALLIEEGETLFKRNDPQARAAFRKILELARDHDQVELAAARLKKLGVEVDLTSHYGFITRWLVVGPFDNSKGIGFRTIYPPEKLVDPKAAYVGKDRKELHWQEHTTTEKLGLVDFNQVIGSLKGAVAYGYTVVTSPTERPIEIRAASNNAVRIYLNGQEVYFREEYHHGMQMDQHIGRGTLKAGRNEILIKVCQNEQTDSWAQQWSFQLRITDALGGAVPVAVVTDQLHHAGGGEE